MHYVNDDGVIEAILQQRKLTTEGKRGKPHYYGDPVSEIDTEELFNAIVREERRKTQASSKLRDEQQRSKVLKKRDFFGFLAGHDTQLTDGNLPVRFKEQQFGGFRQPAEIVQVKIEPSAPKPKKPIPQEVWMGLTVLGFILIPGIIAGLFVLPPAVVTTLKKR